MKLTPYTLQKLVPFVTGDNKLTPYQKGQELVAFFNTYGMKDLYTDTGLPDNLSRRKYTEDRLNKLNGTANLAAALEKVVSETHFQSAELEQGPAVDAMNGLINDEQFSLVEMGGTYKIAGNVAKAAEVVKNEVHFEDIQKQILAELDKARFLIWVAVAWLTDKVLLDKLIEKKKQGLSIQVLVVDDDTNKRIDLDKVGFIKKLKPNGYFGNISHHKFCVIDLERSINGSYNWTIKAQYNNENIVISDDRETAKKFASKFIALKMEL
jgi:hypothetical protein